MTVEPEPVCVLAMSAGNLRSELQAELSIDGYEVRCAESIAEVEARLTPSVADVLVVGSLEDPAAPCALLRGLRDGRLGEGRVAPSLPPLAIVPDGELTSLLRASIAVPTTSSAVRSATPSCELGSAPCCTGRAAARDRRFSGSASSSSTTTRASCPSTAHRWS